MYIIIYVLRCIKRFNHNDYVGLAHVKLHFCLMFWEDFRTNLMSIGSHGKISRSSRDVRERASWSGWARTKALRKDTPGDLQVGDAVLKPPMGWWWKTPDKRNHLAHPRLEGADIKSTGLFWITQSSVREHFGVYLKSLNRKRLELGP